MIKWTGLAFFTLLGFSISAFAVDRYVWNEQGIQKATNCQVTSQDKIPYLAAPKSDGQWEIVAAKSSPPGAAEIRGFTIQIRNETTLKVGDRSLQGTFLQPAFDGNDYLIYVCQKESEKKAYIVFNHLALGAENSAVQIGIANAGFEFLKTATLQPRSGSQKKSLIGPIAEVTPPNPVKTALPMGSKPLVALSPANRAKITFYDPDQNNMMEGGSKNRFDEKINSVEDSIKNGRPVSLAADIYGEFGNLCNQRKKRCLLLIGLKGFDALYPAYRTKFAQLPKDHFLGIVEDTGQAFFNSGGRHFDVAVRNRRLARAVPSFVGSTGAWARMSGPCGTDARSRLCNLTDSKSGSLK